MDVVLGLLLGENLLEWGGGLEEGGQKIRPGGEGGGFIFSVFWVFFSSVFSEVFRGVFFLISGAFGCRFGGHF